MKRLPRLIATVALIVAVGNTWAQKPMHVKITEPIICYATNEDHPFEVMPRDEIIKMRNGARVKTSNIIVQYSSGFTAEAKNAFEAAVSIWEGLISSPVPIRMYAEWTPLSASVLGSALYTNAYANFDGAQKLNVFYPVAIAERITGVEMNGGEIDLFARFNSNVNWHYDPNTSPTTGKYDLVTVVLHEIGHGLGFSGSFAHQGGSGVVGLLTASGERVPIIYDVSIENGSGTNLIAGFASPSTTLGEQLVSQNLFQSSVTAGQNEVYAPSSFNAGSSISHLDEFSFNGTANALMTPQIAPTERIHDPGVALDILKDMGWEATVIEHTKLPNVETTAGPFVVTAKIRQSEAGYDENSVVVHHTLNGSIFSTVEMTLTGNPDEYSATIPSTGSSQAYGYYISVNDGDGRQYLNPGKIVRKNQSQQQMLFTFETGPDTRAPKITHTKKPFLLETDTEMVIDARITDNIGIQSVVLSYSINDEPQPDQNLALIAPEEDSIYRTTITFDLPLQNFDVVKYTITATDNSSNENVGLSPTSGEYEVNVVGLLPTQENYQNDFNTPSDDFFGDGFSVLTPPGFSNAAIHSNHPYQQGLGLPNDELDLVYQLKIPIKVQDADATIKFDEIVLVEPGETGSIFGTDQFYDYVVIEGSTDGGITWKTVADGYDSRANSSWLSKYNSSISGDNSTATGDPTLYKTRTLNLLDKFNAGDEVVIRFRLHSDPLAVGWGWAIDNLKIQVDETAPRILSDHADYLVHTTPNLGITSRPTDASGIKALRIEFGINDAELEVFDFDVSTIASEYTLNLGVDELQIGDVLHYRIVATDSADQVGYFPPSGLFLEVPVIEFEEAVSTYSNDFNISSDDFAGNFFSIAQPANFINGAIHSAHFYHNGIGLLNTSNFTYTLKKPIKISSSNSIIRFDQVVLVEGHSAGAIFGNANFNDYVVVEGSKDGGETWKPFTNGYDIFGEPTWSSAFAAMSNGSAGLYRLKTMDMRASGDFVADDEVLVRFRLFANSTTNGWGWAIDNLYIQDVITDSEQLLDSGIEVYPNPFNESLTIRIEQDRTMRVQLMSVQGQLLSEQSFERAGNYKINTAGCLGGLYLLKIDNGTSTVVKKVVRQ